VIIAVSPDGTNFTDMEVYQPTEEGAVHTFDLTTYNLDDLADGADNLTFRFTFDAASQIGGGNRFDNVKVTGEVRHATINSAQVLFGTLLGGDLDSLMDSDDEYYFVRSRPGLSAFEPNKTEVLFNFTSNAGAPDLITPRLEVFVNNPGATLTVILRNFTTGADDAVQTVAIPFEGGDVLLVLDPQPGDLYVKSNGAIKMTLKTVVMATFSPFGFDNKHDQVLMAEQ
jgi:hypothetical protein